MARERSDHTLQPTALIHEAYLKLAQNGTNKWDNRTRFIAYAAHVMRQILVDHARKYMADKRIGALNKISLTVVPLPQEESMSPLDLLDLDRSLERLAALKPHGKRYVDLIELIWFGGLNLTEAAEELGISRRQATRDWAWSRIWLQRDLGRG